MPRKAKRGLENLESRGPIKTSTRSASGVEVAPTHLLTRTVRIWTSRVDPNRKGFLIQCCEPLGEHLRGRQKKPGCPAIAALEPGIERTIGKLCEVGIRTRDARGAARFAQSVDPFRQVSLRAPASPCCGAIDPNLRSRICTSPEISRYTAVEVFSLLKQRFPVLEVDRAKQPSHLPGFL